MDNRTLVAAAMECLMRSLPPELNQSLLPEWKPGSGDAPDFFPKPRLGMDYWRGKVLPIRVERRPVGFWSRNKGFYEMSAGEHDGKGSIRARFMFAGNQKGPVKGCYNKAVNELLASAKHKRPDLEFIPVAEKTYGQLCFYGNDAVPQRLAEPMLWIIENTLRQIQGIQVQ